MGERRKSLSEYLAMEYPFEVIADPTGGYLIKFTDLPGCLAQVENLDEIPSATKDVFSAWIEDVYESGEEIPLPSYPEEFSGKFNVRLPKSLHRRLVEEAKREDMSLNAYVTHLLSERHSVAILERQLADIRAQLIEMRVKFHYQGSGRVTEGHGYRRYEEAQTEMPVAA